MKHFVAGFVPTFIAAIGALALLGGCDDVGSLLVTPEGCRGRASARVTITQEVTATGVKCTVEYRK